MLFFSPLGEARKQDCLDRGFLKVRILGVKEKMKEKENNEVKFCILITSIAIGKNPKDEGRGI